MRARNAAPEPQQEHNTEGFSFFLIAGIVQGVKENEKMHCDYVHFNIQSKIKPEYFDIISVCVPHDLNILCEVGDAVTARGWVRAWQRGGAITLELVAERVEPVDPEKLRGARHG